MVIDVGTFKVHVLVHSVEEQACLLRGTLYRTCRGEDQT